MCMNCSAEEPSMVHLVHTMVWQLDFTKIQVWQRGSTPPTEKAAADERDSEQLRS